ncbi:MAG: hypothetical protein ACYDCK_07075 [Thermoplasmatota archaeon]
MSFPRVPLALAVLAMMLVAGCIGGSGTGAPAAPSLSAAGEKSSSSNASDVPIDQGNSTNISTGATPHKHDYWRGRERVTVIDRDVPVTLQSRQAFFTLLTESRPAFGAAQVNLPDGQIVYEGTGRLEFTATWTDATVTGLVMRYASTGNPQLSAPIPLTSGTMVPIEVKADMTDDPHASSSLWRFVLEASGPGGAGVAQGTVHVKADIVKMRDIETFPAHPDLFHGQPLVKIVDKDMTLQSDDPTAGVEAFTQHDFTPAGFAPDAPVPPDAKSVLLLLTVKSATYNNPLGDSSKISMNYKTARSSFNERPANLTQQVGKVYLFSMHVGQGDGDSFYAKTSQWRFDPIIDDNVQGTPLQCPLFFTDCFTWSMDVHVTAYAFQTVAGPNDFPKG